MTDAANAHNSIHAMLIDLEHVEYDPVCEVDVCIVGSGPSGITLALELSNQDLTCALLESGGFRASAAARELNRGVVRGQPSWPLTASRTRCLGGTSARWRGWCRPLEPGDLEPRPWIDHSGWPIRFDELAAPYRRAHAVCRAGQYWYGDPAAWASDAGVELLDLAGTGLEQRLYMFSPIQDFGDEYWHGLSSPSIRGFVNATVTELVPSTAGDRVVRVVGRSPSGRRVTVHPRHVVLAGGAIENARILLAAQARALPWGGAWVGRAFADHPHVLAGALVPAHARWLPGYDATAAGPGGWGRMVLALPEGALRDLGVPGATAILQPVAAGAGRAAWAILARSEQVPNPASRIALADELDGLGVPRALVDWRLSRADLTAVAALVDRLAAALPRMGLGEVVSRMSASDPRWPADLVGGCHHMGTTRMAADVRGGAVDRDGKVFGTDNLYAAGSSVFCTAGVANPTLTIVALALRLAEHLAGRLGATGPRVDWYDAAVAAEPHRTGEPGDDGDDETEAFLRAMSADLTTRMAQMTAGSERTR